MSDSLLSDWPCFYDPHEPETVWSDLALLVFLRLEGERPQPRDRLAALLWGDSQDRRARHSLTQALGRIQRCLAPGSVAVSREAVRWQGELACDAVRLHEWAGVPDAPEDVRAIYPGEFLAGFSPGRGAW